MARLPARPILNEQEFNQLKLYANSHKAEKRLTLRAQIILDWYEDLSYKSSALKNQVSEMVIAKWRRRFGQAKLDGLSDQYRSGKPAVITQAQRKRVMHLACAEPDNGKQKWSHKDISAKTGISASMVGVILSDAELKPHKTDYWCGKSPDPDFESKMLNIVGLYLDPPQNALVLSVDEKTQIQALDRTQPELPMQPGRARRLTNTYKRNGTANLIASLAVHTGEITARTMERNDSDNFLKFLKLLDRKYRLVELHIIVDNLSVHKNKDVLEWVNKKRKIHLHFTPTYSSWLNQIEIWFSILTRDVLKDAVWTSKKHLVDQMMLYIKNYNEKNAKPFAWTYGKDKLN